MSQAEQKARLIEKLKRELGPVVLSALADPSVVEVMLNGDGSIWLDVVGKGMINTGSTLPAQQSMSAMATIASMLETVVTSDKPILEGELPLDGSRFEGLIPPNVPSPVFAIRKKALLVYTLDNYVASNIMTEAQALAIREAVRNRENVLIVGGTGTGKTTLANAILAEIADSDDRIILIEDTVELQCRAKNRVELRTSESADMIRLLRATMRMRPDRIVVGEVRGAEALALLKAWNTGHPGGCATVHANSAEAGLVRLEQLIQEANVPPQPALIAEAVNVIVSIKRTVEGRRIEQVCRVAGYTARSGYKLVDI